MDDKDNNNDPTSEHQLAQPPTKSPTSVLEAEQRFRYLGYFSVGSVTGLFVTRFALATYRHITHDDNPFVPVLIDWAACGLAACGSITAAYRIGRIRRQRLRSLAKD